MCREREERECVERESRESVCMWRAGESEWRRRMSAEGVRENVYVCAERERGQRECVER